jgi:hypothetical protein
MTPARKKLYDANKSSEALVYLSSDSRTQIDKPVATRPRSEERFRANRRTMYLHEHAFEDLEGAYWNSSPWNQSLKIRSEGRVEQVRNAHRTRVTCNRNPHGVPLIDRGSTMA